MTGSNPDFTASIHALLQGSAAPGDPLSSAALTSVLIHGGLQELAVPDVMPFALSRFAGERQAAVELTAALRIRVQAYFSKLDNFEYIIPSPLISFLSHKPDGRLYTQPGVNAASTLPAAFTFIGQFIDHDLTKNAFELFADQSGTVPDIASPLIDLDSVYGSRSDAKVDLFEHGRFKISAVGSGYDVPRSAKGEALIADGRNDENQLILQIHLLLMRLHNVLVRHHGLPFHEAKRETIFTWQSIVLNDYLVRIAEPTTLQYVLSEIVKPDHGALLHKPQPHPKRGHLSVTMPHEFAIGFRFGHSQLRDHYTLSNGHGFPLFDNTDTGPNFRDLRGNRSLTPDRIIDWPFFFSGSANHEKLGNMIDGKVTDVVFELPESAVPDMATTTVNNLTERNLIRSRSIKLTSGERLAMRYGIGPVLTPAQIEPDASKHRFFDYHGEFATPLWYYILKEAESAGGSHLGKLGSRLVAEVIAGGIYYNRNVGQEAFVFDSSWKAVVKNKTTNVVKFEDLFQFVSGQDA